MNVGTGRHYSLYLLMSRNTSNTHREVPGSARRRAGSADNRCCRLLRRLISYYDAIVLSADLRISKLNQFNIRLIFITFIHNIQRSNKYKYNKCIGDDTKAATRQSPNCIKKNKKNKNKIWLKMIFNMADGIITSCNVACGSGMTCHGSGSQPSSILGVQ